MEKKTYRLTADIGDKKRGETIQLTDEKAASRCTRADRAG